MAEGDTEIGLCRALAEYWSTTRGTPLAQTGTVPTRGGGNSAPTRAEGFAKLGYSVALLMDSDTGPPPNLEELEEAGVLVLSWEGSVSTEERIALDLPERALSELLELAADLRDEEDPRASIRNAIQAKLPENTPPLEGFEPLAWKTDTVNLQEIRKGIGAAAKSGGWFKRIEYGERLGQLVIRHLPNLAHTDLASKVCSLELFAYAERDVAGSSAGKQPDGCPAAPES